MVLSHKNSNPRSTATKPGGCRNPTLSRAQIAQRQTLSYQPAVVANRPSSVLESSTSTSAFAHRQDDLLHYCVRPFIQGLKDDSTLIDITSMSDLHELKQFFGSFNTETYFPYSGTLLVERRYLQRRFIETFWEKTSAEYERLLGNGLTMEDGTVIKGYPSLPSDAEVARVKVERLTFINPLNFKRFNV
ncbi:hypothetical protein BD560DRAFT_489874 [Blakeslea trispora]|nr:hypothetical protein BD560DRAFT_489874 [Blakeslea trispora]